ncbi:MAG: ferritin family protein [Planctomycetota bacterium]
MVFDFNADEIFGFALAMERNGAAFYLKARDHARDPATAEMLESLARWEERHEKRFAAMKEKFAKARPSLASFDPQGEVAQYLAAFVDNRVFPKNDPSKKLTGKETLSDLLHVAIGLEKDSIAFYAGVKEWAPQNLGKVEVGEIIGEEMQHVRILTARLADETLKDKPKRKGA